MTNGLSLKQGTGCEGGRKPTRGWLVVGLVLSAHSLGALATVIIYVTRPAPGFSTTTLVNVDTVGVDGLVLVLEPQTGAEVRIVLGMTLEVVLPPGVGQDVVSSNLQILAPTAIPACNFAKLCGFPGAHIWAFRTVRLGLTELQISFGISVCQVNRECSTIPLVDKPILVATTN
jgi:hypothetical protein